MAWLEDTLDDFVAGFFRRTVVFLVFVPAPLALVAVFLVDFVEPLPVPPEEAPVDAAAITAVYS